MNPQRHSVSGAAKKIAGHPDFDRLISEAERNRKPVPLDRAQQELGDLLGELDLSDETLVLRGDMPVAFTPTTWLRLIRAARARQQRP